MRRDVLKKVRAVVVGRAVEIGRADGFEGFEVIGVVILRPLKHHVLEEMREASAPAPLVLRSDVIPDVDGDNRRSMIFMQDDSQAVLERVFLVRDLRWLDLLRKSYHRNSQHRNNER